MFQDMVDNARRSANTEWLKHLRSHVTRTRIDNVVALARADSVIAASPDEFDRYTLWVNCLNLVLEMPVDGKEPLRFHDHRPEDMLTRQAAVKYVPGAKCPVFLKALNFWTGGDKELQRTIQQLLGLSITGVTRQQSFFILHGEGNTGKSTLLETVTTILGSYAKAVPSDVFLKQRNGTPEERKMAMLPGVRFATCSETPANGQLDENLLKRMTGEDTMSYRRLYEEQSDFKPEFKAWLRTNNLPQISGTGNDIWRRVIPIPFGRVVPEALKDLDLKDKLKQELEGIFAWMVEGYLDYAKNGLVKAAVVEQDAQTYRKEQDLIEQFLEATCEFDSSYNVGKEELFFAYKSWCDSRGRRPLDVKVFKKELLSERFKGRHIELKEMGPKGHRVEKWKGLDLSTKLFEKKHAPKPE
jgi:putative DNA primase/helicase